MSFFAIHVNHQDHKQHIMNAPYKKAISAFDNGFNCAQSVLLAYYDEIDLDKDQALMLSLGFGGGMGRLQETCGAVTGAFMFFGAYNCRKYTDAAERKERTYEMIQKFNMRFIELNGSTLCRELLKCDLKTEEGQEFAQINNLIEIVCEKCINDSITIIEELIRK